VIEKCGLPFLQPIHDLVSQQVARGRVALLGDAAFVARPHVGMGVTKAMQDALVLESALRLHGPTPQALRAYAAERVAASQAVVQRGRRLGAYMQACGQDGNTAQARDAMAVMAETATDPEQDNPEENSHERKATLPIA
jgi:2-polyprenyl-6-methoxyphenol hydroxylase-like FAD-dependent oxidoreductase